MIEIKDVHIKLGDFSLEHIDFKVEEGMFYILLGPTGAGKSVILETIVGLIEHHSGHIFIDGQNIENLKPEKRNIAICYQDYVLFPHMTVKENIEYGLKYKNVNDSNYFKELIDLLKIRHLLDRYPINLSGGEKQRVSLARALVIKPKVLLLDEPLSALDVHIKDQLMRDIKRLHEQFGMTTIMVTHSFQEAYYLGDKVSVINDGRIVQSGTMEEILNQPNSDFVSNFVGLKNIISSDKLGSVFNGAINTNYVGVRPENVKIFKTEIEGGFTGVLSEIIDMGTFYEVIIDSEMGILVAYMMMGEFIKTDIEVNQRIYFKFSNEDILKLNNYIV
ncbi:MAG: ABC transporter ATP-binding protein [Clostridiales bacterium]|nr:ABC transporter ATP-binding protein [Clostridiales bacterium]